MPIILDFTRRNLECRANSWAIFPRPSPIWRSSARPATWTGDCRKRMGNSPRAQNQAFPKSNPPAPFQTLGRRTPPRQNHQKCQSRLGDKSPAARNIACGRHIGCYFSHAVQLEKHPISRRTRQRLFLAAGVVSLAVWLLMATAEVCTPLHAWLHGGAIPTSDDDCAIVVIAHGKTEVAPVIMPVAAAVRWVEVAPRIESCVYSAAIACLPDGRAPPVFSAVS